MEVETLFPRAHGVTLHQAICVLAGNTALDQVEQQLSAEDEAARALEVRQHALGIDEHGLDQVRRLVEQVVGERSRVRNDDAFGRGVRNIALVPERDVLESGLRVRSHHARQSRDLFAGHRIALVRHGRRALLLFAEIFFGLADFGALQVADFGGDLVERRCDRGERCQIVGMAVALNYLRRDGGGL